jgi:hypothetical protein
MFASGVICGWLAISSQGASLSGTFTPVVPGTTVGFSAGEVDWVLWGLSGAETSVRKSGVPPLIGNPVVIGPNVAESVVNFPVLFNWSDGTPVPLGTNETAALAVHGLANGFALNIPAGTLKRKLRLYVGCQQAQGNLQAFLSDGSAPGISDSTLSATAAIAAGVYDVSYTAASEGQTLTLSWTVGQTSDAVAANVQLAAAILSTNIPPMVAITNPPSGSTFTAPANVPVAIDAQDPDGAIAKVELYSGITKIADLANAPYDYLLTNLAVGSYTISARAFDNDGDQVQSAPVSFSVISNLPPTVTILSPINDANFVVSDVIILSATAEDPHGVVRVQWYVDNKNAGESLSSPYTITLTNTPVGFHTIKAVAEDPYHAEGTSAVVTIAVNSGLGSLSLVYGIAPLKVNLSAEGLSDWAHWGLFSASSYNHKAGVTPQIGNYSVIGHDTPYSYYDNFTAYSWNNGTPVASASDTPSGVYVAGLKSGFEVRVAADTTLKTLKLYVGTYAARGRLRAYLTDLSTPVYFDQSLNNTNNGPDAVYTLRYQASAPGQFLVAQYIVADSYDPFGNATLQAATLVSDNNPPDVSLISPTNYSVFMAPANIVLEATAGDNDGMVARVEFYQDAEKLGEALGPSYEFHWTNVIGGNYSLTARAIDDKGATLTSVPVEISVINGGGYLAGSFFVPPSQVNLTFEGRGDWAHWGYRNRSSFDHKRLVPQQVSNFVAIGTQPTEQDSNVSTPAFTWSDGTPTLNGLATRTFVFCGGLNNGFEMALPADQALRRLKVYAGVYGARGRFEATLSDFSAPRYLDMALLSGGNKPGLYILYYAAASSNQTLTLRYQSDLLIDAAYGNVTLQSATLAVVPPLPVLQIFRLADGLGLSVPTEPSFGYAVECSPTLTSPTWNLLTNFIAILPDTIVTNLSTIAPASFYRMRMW